MTISLAARALFALPALVVVAVAAPAQAHQVGLSRSAWVVSGSSADVELTFARPDVLTLLPEIDGDKDAVISDAELKADTRAVQGLWQQVHVERGAHACTVAAGDASLVEGDGVVAAARVDCNEGDGDVVVTLAILEKLGSAHRHLGHVSSAKGETDVVAFTASPSFTLTAAPAGLPVGDYFVLGLEHILLGYDHLCFVLGLVIVLVTVGKLRSLFAVITAFTVAHSITLGLAATGTATLPSSLIEPLIAASIVFVGVESWRLKAPAARWRITFPFGLIHGFGFAGALAEIGLPKDAVVPALALFNVGVEAGQLAVLLLLTPVLLLLRKKLPEKQQHTVVRVVSAAVVVAGGYWLIERVIGLL